MPLPLRLTVAVASLATCGALVAPSSAWALDETPSAPAPAPATDEAPAPAPGVVSVRLARTQATIGTKVVLSGTASGGSREVSLQTRDARGRWRTLQVRRSSATGTFRFATPTWNRTHPLRVTASGTASLGSATSKVVKLRRTVPRTTGGKASSWRPIYSRVIRWNPCETHSVRINTRNAPAWFASEVKSALRNIRLYTGIPFTYAGTTKRSKPSAQTDVVLRWTTARSDKRLAGATAGLGGNWSNGTALTSGFVLLDREEKVSRAAWRAVLRHELAHVVGLNHVNDPRQRMYPRTDVGGDISYRSRTWGRGDVAGLKRVGASYGCIG